MKEKRYIVVVDDSVYIYDSSIHYSLKEAKKELNRLRKNPFFECETIYIVREIREIVHSIEGREL